MIIMIVAHSGGGANAYYSLIEEIAKNFSLKLISIGNISMNIWNCANIIKVNNSFSELKNIIENIKPGIIMSETSSANPVITKDLTMYCQKQKIKHISLLEKYKKTNKENILFISQCFAEDGYLKTQDMWFREWFSGLKDRENKNILIKLHPREKGDWIKPFLSEITLIEEMFIDVTAFAAWMNQVVGVSSTILYEIYMRNLAVKTNVLDPQFYFTPTMRPYSGSIKNIKLFRKYIKG